MPGTQRNGRGGRNGGSGEAAGPELVADRYQLVTRLGRGGMGEVWAGRDTRLHRDVAVKIFRGGSGMSPAGLPDWLRAEGIAAAQINHPNVAVLYDQGSHRDRVFLVMELVSGATLADVMRGGRLPVADALRFATQIADALAAAHAAGVVHRDIKPQNVLVTPDGTVKVVDFGIAGFLSDTRSWTIARYEDAVKGSGTPEYAAPEQVTGHTADARSDLYSLGTLLFAMLTGHVPFQAENFLAVMHRKVTEDAPPLGADRGGLPAELVALVGDLLAREPERRPGSARQVAARLRAVAEAPARVQAQVEVEGSRESLEKPLRQGSELGEGGSAGSGAGVERKIGPAAGSVPAAADGEVGSAPDEAGVQDAESAAPDSVPDRGEPKSSAAKSSPSAPAAAAGSAPDRAEPKSSAAGSSPSAPEPAKPKPSAAAAGSAPDRAEPEPSAPDRAEPEPSAAGSGSSAPAAAAGLPPEPAEPDLWTAPPLEPDPPKPKPKPKPPQPRPAPKKAAPKPKSPAKPEPEPDAAAVWSPGASKERNIAAPEPSPWEPHATGATMLSPLAALELRGRSLLPPPVRSLLRENPPSAFLPSQPELPPPPRSGARRVVGFVALGLLVVATIAAVAYGVAHG